MTIGDVLSWVLVGFVFIWAADVLRLWERYDLWREGRSAWTPQSSIFRIPFRRLPPGPK